MGASSAAEEETIYTDLFVGDRSWNGRERNRLLLNGGGWPLIDVSAATGAGDRRDGRGFAVADYDQDGDLDFAVANYEAPAAIWINRWGQERAWAAVRLEGRPGINRDAIGATLVAQVGEQRMLRVVGAGHGYAGQNSLEQLFGLGDAERIDVLEVRWPDGSREAFGPLAAGTRSRLVQGSGRQSQLESQRGVPLVPPPEDFELPTWLLFAMLIPPGFLIAMATYTRKLGSGGAEAKGS